MTSPVTDPDLSMKIAEDVAKILADKHPAVQGAAIADILGTYIAGHLDPDMRVGVMNKVVETAWKIVEAYSGEGAQGVDRSH